MSREQRKPSIEALRVAKQNPGGWVYEIDSKYASSETVPPEGIIGAWKVDSSGNISEAFIPNPKYKRLE